MREAGAAAASTAVDAFPAHEDAAVLDGATTDGDNDHWTGIGTVDALCLGNGYAASDGTQGAYITWRFMLGPFGSLHEWALMYRTGPDHGIVQCSLASIPENDPTSGAADPTGVLQDISTLNFISLSNVLNGYSAALTRNVRGFWPASLLRVMGQPGDPFTTATFDPILGTNNIDGGPGPYALKLTVTDKAVASTGYIFDLQALHRKRTDWAFG